MNILALLITGLLFSNQVVSSLKLTIKSNEIPLRSSSSLALKKTFKILRREGRYDAIHELLELETFDTMPPYVESCTSMTMNDYQRIVEHFFLKNEFKKLSKILSPDCVLSMDKMAFRDPVTALSLRDLPKSLLALKTKGFCLRTRGLKTAYLGAILTALKHRSTSIDWDNVVRTPPMILTTQEHLPLAEAFSNSILIRPNLLSDLFYYLSFTMIRECRHGDDIIWLVQNVLPRDLDLPVNEKYVDPRILSAWDEQVFRTISTLAFFIELVDIEKRFANRKRNANLVVKMEEAKALASDALDRFNLQVTNALKLQPACEPLKRTLTLISSIYSIFFTETMFSNAFINHNYKLIYKKFASRSPFWVQGDWMYNLFFVFFKRKFHALRLEEIDESVQIYFGRKPTLPSIGKFHSLYIASFNYINPNSQVSHNFERQVPADRLEEVFERFPWIFNHRFTEIPFATRLKHHLKEGRRRLSEYDYAYKIPFSVKELPKASKHKNKIDIYKKKLIETFQTTVRALNNFDPKPTQFRSYTKFNLVATDFSRLVGITEILEHFFELVLKITDFRIITSHYKDGRPILIITPLISKDVANILGQALAVASILSVKVPFVMHRYQFDDIFGGERDSDHQMILKRKIVKFCNKPGYLNLIVLDQKRESHFWNALSRYFTSFQSWRNLFYKSEDPLQSATEELIQEAVIDCHSQIYAGFRLFFSTSKFSNEEINQILFKININ